MFLRAFLEKWQDPLDTENNGAFYHDQSLSRSRLEPIALVRTLIREG
jgi:hypothetical protein